MRFGPAELKRRQSIRNLGSDGVRIVLNIEIPHPHHLPACRAQRIVLGRVAREVALDLFVPVAAPTARLPLAGMAVPERSIHEHRQPPTRERDVNAAAGAAPVAAPASHPGAPKRVAKQQLWFGERQHATP